MTFTISHKAIFCTKTPDHPAVPLTESPATRKEQEKVLRRRKNALRLVDRKLSKGNHKHALSIVKQLQGTPRGLRGFGAAKQVPKGISSLDKLELDETNLGSICPLFDSVLDSIRLFSEVAPLGKIPANRVSSLMENLGKKSWPEDHHLTLTQHEAGHFLIGYLLGVLPSEYEIPSIEYMKENARAFAKVGFAEFGFFGEVRVAHQIIRHINKQGQHHRRNGSRISYKVMNNFLCIVLGGLVAEHLEFGYAEGFHHDINKLDTMLQQGGFSESEAELRVKWAALNTILILIRHQEARLKLAEAMASGRSIGSCIDAIENAIHGKEV